MDVSRGSARVLITPNTSDSEMVALTDGNTDSNLKKKQPPPLIHIPAHQTQAFTSTVQLQGWLPPSWRSNSNMRKLNYERARVCV